MAVESLLELRNITKVYDNGVVANRNIVMSFRKGEIHAIVGENGAGKTTLMNILFGLVQPTTGVILREGKEQRFSSPSDSIAIGIGMVHQHFMLVPSFTVFENISLGCEETQFGFLSERESRKRTKELCARYGFDLPLDEPVKNLGVGVKQKVEILKLLYKGATVLILDEPTAVLTPQETAQLFSQLKGFKEQGHTIIFISHKLREVKEISDRITVIRRGESLGTMETAGVSVEEVSEMMIGRKVEYEYSGIKRQPAHTEPCVEVKNLFLSVEKAGSLKNISFTIHNGEILGLIGVEGNGQTELVEVLFGYKKPNGGTMTVKGISLGERSIKDIRKTAKTAYIPEDRMRQGIAAKATVAENLISSYYDRPSLNKPYMMDRRAIGTVCADLVKQFSIVCQGIDSPVYSLSGGNIQKVVVAREANAEPDFLIAEQPTRGVDIGSANAIHKILIGLRNFGKAILLVSADLGEALAISDRLMVMYSGEIVAIFDAPQSLTEQELGLYMLGIKRQS
ncbi:MAG: ABC transporter ATP-binding protein [Treponema sp.]|jgi:simple sugar transport system ATP-binding protein|nr:ABC transporter ATP-binding protein [Treponema sp.]